MSVQGIAGRVIGEAKMLYKAFGIKALLEASYFGGSAGKPALLVS
jgi:hypothetical protein